MKSIKIESETELPLATIDVIIPVYEGLEETAAAIESAAATIDRKWARLVVINDHSPNPNITEWLNKNAERLGYILLNNEKNIGFVATVNRGFLLNRKADIVILNSDVEVANDWLSRLRKTAYSRDKVASVTATSNNATICSFPSFCKDNELFADLSVEQIDSSLRKHSSPDSTTEIPTGVGCCMYIRRDAIDDVGLFDEETFGRGYGEENDWCQRAIFKGWVNLQALNVFVYHKGAVSFADDSSPKKEANLKLLDKRYPSYLTDVHRFIAEDPAKPYRLQSLIGLIGDLQKPKVLAISHGLGGGIKTHILQLTREKPEAHFLLLEPESEDTLRLNLIPFGENSSQLTFRLHQDKELLLNILRSCGVSHIHFHHSMGIPRELWDLPDALNVKMDYTLHDFWVINGNPTQTDKNGHYVGDCDNRDSLCQNAYPLPAGIKPSAWRYQQLQLMERARYLICPSSDTFNRIHKEREFKQLQNWYITPHLDHHQLKNNINKLSGQEGPLKVIIIGALSREKGADILEATAEALKNENIEFHLLGYAYRDLAKAVITHGPYNEDECLEKIQHIRPDIAWFTAQWPETYSYTLSIAIQAELPIVAPMIGAFPERLSGRQSTFMMKDYDSTHQWVSFWRDIIKNPNQLIMSQAPSFEPIEYCDSFYSRIYLKDVPINPATPPPDKSDLDILLENSRKLDQHIGKREATLHLLVKLRHNPATRWIALFLPFKLQRAIKRALSRKPLHDITPS